jgi:hypothetical protein
MNVLGLEIAAGLETGRIKKKERCYRSVFLVLILFVKEKDKVTGGILPLKLTRGYGTTHLFNAGSF